MIKEHGTFTTYTDPMRSGVLMKNENGEDWHRFVLLRVMFDDRGGVVDLYDEDFKTKIDKKERSFATVKDGIVQFVSNGDPSALEPRNMLVIETDKPVEVGMLYDGKKFLPAPPPPVTVNKHEVIASLSEEQFASWDEKYAKATPKQRVTWENGFSFRQGTPEYQVAQSLLVGIFGPDGYNFFPK